VENVIVYKHNMCGFVIRRVLIAVITFFILSFIIFVLITVAKSRDITDPFPIGLNKQFDTDFQEYIRLQKEPYLIKYFRWIGDIFMGDFGESLIGNSFYSK
jgi:ABC-type dipeptide/oligopeptide/nickel transport system permease component